MITEEFAQSVGQALEDISPLEMNRARELTVRTYPSKFIIAQKIVVTEDEQTEYLVEMAYEVLNKDSHIDLFNREKVEVYSIRDVIRQVAIIENEM